MIIQVEVPDGLLHPEEGQDRQLAELLLRDALWSFVVNRTKAEDYVNSRYPDWKGEVRESKIAEVQRRVEVAMQCRVFSSDWRVLEVVDDYDYPVAKIFTSLSDKEIKDFFREWRKDAEMSGSPYPYAQFCDWLVDKCPEEVREYRIGYVGVM